MVVLVDAYAIGDAQRLVAGVDGCAGVALLVGIVPEGVVAVKLEVELAGLHLGLLQAEEVGVQLAEDIFKALAHTGTQAIDIP